MNKTESIDLWFQQMKEPLEDSSNEIYKKLLDESPQFISWVAERACNLQCQHCIFQKEKSIAYKSCSVDFILNIVKQSPKNTPFIHEGRILKRKHLSVIDSVQQLGHPVGLIDNGTFIHNTSEFNNKLNWIDISIDGTETIHNKQRLSKTAYLIAIEGLCKGREVADKVTSLFTITSLNYHNIKEACEAVIHLIDEFHITPLSPSRKEILGMETNTQQMQIAWEQIKFLTKEYPEKIKFRSYRHEDIFKIIYGNKNEFASAFFNPTGLGTGKIVFEYQEVNITWIPKSISSTETLVIDADLKVRIPYGISFSLKELDQERDCFGNDISFYTIQKLDLSSNLKSIYQIGLKQWWENLGHHSLELEKSRFNLIK